MTCIRRAAARHKNLLEYRTSKSPCVANLLSVSYLDSRLAVQRECLAASKACGRCKSRLIVAQQTMLIKLLTPSRLLFF